MLTSKVAKRYAQGLLDFTKETGEVALVYTEMKDVVKIMNESKELNRFFQTPFIDRKKKKAVAQEIFKNFSSASQKIIQLVIHNGREVQLQNVAQEFINKVEDLEGVQRITLTSASALSEKNISEILKSTALINPSAKYDVKTIINPEILGGYILRVGDQQVDASIKSKLNQIQKDFQLN